MPAVLRKLVLQRASIRQSVGDIVVDITSNSATLDHGTLVGYQQRLEDDLKSLTNLDGEIFDEYESAGKDDNFLSQECTECRVYVDKIKSAQGTLKVLLIPFQTQVTSPSHVNTSIVTNSARASMKFPDVPMPTFEGKASERLEDFIDNFESTLAQTSVFPLETFLLLKKSVKGDAAKLIASIRPSDQAYDLAKKMLQEAYGQSTKQKFLILESLIETKMTFKDHIFDHYSKMQNLCDALERAQLDTDFLKQFFLWRSFNGPLQEAFTMVTGKYRPSYRKIQSSKFEAAERYRDRQNSYNERQKRRSLNKSQGVNNETKVNKSGQTKTSGLAANVPGYNKSEKTEWCNLCSKTSYSNQHKMRNCEQFKTAKQKVDRLESINGCIRCGYVNHQKSSCKFEFKHPCTHCGGKHFAWLCLKGEAGNSATLDSSDDECSDQESKNESESEQSVDGNESNGEAVTLCSVEVMKACAPTNSILPTCTVKINGKKYRSLRDTGCQQNFISKHLFEKADIKAKEKVTLTINGFNSSKNYKCKLAEVPLEFGNSKFKIEAIVLPEINVRFMAEGLDKIAHVFKSKGFKLADHKFGRDSSLISNLDLVLGADTANIFSEKTVLFGKNPQSAFLDTIGGIMPLGNSLRMISNLKYISELKKPKVEKSQATKVSNAKPVTASKPIQTVKNNVNKVNTKLLGAGTRNLISTIGNSSTLTNAMDYDFGQVLGDKKATTLDLQHLLDSTIGYDPITYNDQYSELNEQLVDYTLDRT